MTQSSRNPSYWLVLFKSLPARYENAVTQIGVREDCTLEEAKAIIESLHDDISVNMNMEEHNRTTHSGRTYSAAEGGRGRNNGTGKRSTQSLVLTFPFP